MMSWKRRILPLLGLLALTQSAVAQSRMGSIYNPDRGPVGLVGNKTARRVGDLVTVIISENQDLKNEETSDLSKTTDLNYQLLNFNLKPDAFNTLPSLNATSTDDFQGTANYEKRGEFTARLTALVVDKLPNGNLVIQGRREIRIDEEVKLIEFSGVVRSYDVSALNTVQSELVADARVAYSGSGPLTRTTRRRGLGGLVHDALSWLWPF